MGKTNYGVSTEPLTGRAAVEEYLRCAEDVQYFIENYCTIRDKYNGNLVNAKLLYNQKKILSDLLKYKDNSIFKYRQAGGTTLACLYLIHQLVFKKVKNGSLSVIVVSNTLAMAKDLISYISMVINNLPDFLRIIPDGKDTANFKRYDNGAKIIAVAASRDGTRGYCPDIVLIDEFLWCQHLDWFMNSLQGSMNIDAQIIKMTSDGEKHELMYNWGHNSHFTYCNWFDDERFQEGMQWKKGDLILKHVHPEDTKTLLLDGYQPESDWSRKMLLNYDNRVDLFNQQMGKRFYYLG